MPQHRTESDSIGSVDLPVSCYYGIQTERARRNFPITGVPLAEFPSIIVALAMVKSAAAKANAEIGGIDSAKAQAIVEVCDEIVQGQHHDHFVVDMIQGGAGTSTNMNANEVIANLALGNLGHAPGEYAHLHPNDDVNHGQSTNDVYPTAIRLAVLFHAAPLSQALERLQSALEERAEAFAGVAKVGRTQLQDAVPMSLGAEFKSFAVTVGEDIDRIREVGSLLTEINLGGTAIGTRVNAEAGYDKRAVAHLSGLSGFDLKQASDLIEASSDLGGFVTFSGILKRVAVKLSKMCNDLRLLSSGPRAGFGEIILPAVQAGSSIMPGKVNPVIPEVVNQVCYQVIGNDLTITMAAEAGQLQLNAMEPVVAYNLLKSLKIMINAVDVLTEKCVTGIRADAGRCAALLDNSLVLATALAPHLGYDAAAKIAKQALATGRSIREVASESSLLSAEQLDQILSPAAMLAQGITQEVEVT
ncbi:aspartate ammonia-lyase [Rhodobacteraceae bacterium B1Z28]|uniref:Aspartate ammonia-lyase n=1 Tax=Ruegeria haliotis TaxID=2747601 RepID=A0ABX2PXU0_9RHOB|nr:aspartate ammonia-lyase [Ruegeria haliotis]NVO58460.1 aspartate ammonia-lyase [Ruegeria haliotis]